MLALLFIGIPLLGKKKNKNSAGFFFFFNFLRIKVCLWLVVDAGVNINRVSNCRDINRVSKTRFPGGHQMEKRQIRLDQNIKIESLRLDL